MAPFLSNFCQKWFPLNFWTWGWPPPLLHWQCQQIYCFFFDVTPYVSYTMNCLYVYINPILCGGKGHICPPIIPIHFSIEPHDRGSFEYTQKLNFVITDHLKFEKWTFLDYWVVGISCLTTASFLNPFFSLNFFQVTHTSLNLNVLCYVHYSEET